MTIRSRKDRTKIEITSRKKKSKYIIRE